MTRSIAADTAGDIYIAADGSLATVTSRDAVMQACAQAARTQLGEMQYATDQGIPNFATVWNGSPNLSQFEAYLRRALSSVADVQGVKSVTITASGSVLSYTAEIQTIYGPGLLNG